MNGADPRPHLGRIQTALPARGGMTPVGALEGKKVGGIAHTQARRVLEDRHKFGVEAHVYAARVVIELEIGEQRHLREDILDEHGFTPTAVTDDQIGAKALAAQFPALVGYGRGGIDRTVDIDRIRMAVDAPALIFGISDLVNARHGVNVRLSNEVELIARLVRQAPEQVHVLRGEVLMYEQIV